MSILTFPGGQVVDVEYDDAAHSYVVAHQLSDGSLSGYRPTHGITAPLSVVPKGFLKPWAAKEAVLALLAYIELHPALLDVIPQFFTDLEAYELKTRENGKPVMSYYRLNKLYPWFAECKKACDIKSNSAKKYGHWLHSAIEHYYLSDRTEIPMLTPDTSPMWDAFLVFDNEYKPQPDPINEHGIGGLEFLVYSLLFGYSGQGDFRGVMSNKTCIGDWKTTNRSDMNPNGIDIEYFFQVGGLAQAEYERTGQWVQDLFIANFDKTGSDHIVIWASECGFSPQDCAKAYLSCLQTYHTIEYMENRFKRRA